MLKTLRALAALMALAISPANAQSYGPINFGIDKSSSPYKIGVNLGGTFYNIGQITSGGIPTPYFPGSNCPSSQWQNAVSSLGVFACARPDAADVTFTQTGSTLQQTEQTKLARIVDLDDYKLGADTSDCAAFQRAHDNAVGATIRLPARQLEMGTAGIACQVAITTANHWLGTVAQETGASGTVIHIPNTTSSPFLISGTGPRGAVFENLMVKQDQPAPTGGWTPTVYPPVFDNSSTGGTLFLRNILAAPVYDLISSVGSGRLNASNIRGQVLRYTFNVDNSLDSDRYEDIHIWPYWSGDTNVTSWTQANAITFNFGRLDTPFIDRAFTLDSLALIKTSTTGSGNPSKIMAGSLGCDFCKYGLHIDSDNFTANIGSLMWQGQSVTAVAPITNGRMLNVTGDAARISIGSVIGERADTSMIDAAGLSNLLFIGSAQFSLANQDNVGANIVGTLGASSGVSFGNTPEIEGSNGATCGVCSIPLFSANGFTQSAIFTPSLQVYHSSEVNLFFNIAGAGADQKIWDFKADTSTFRLRARTDNLGTSNDVFSCTRSAAVVSVCLWSAPISGPNASPISTKVANYSATNADHSLIFNCAVSCTLTLPASPPTGFVIRVRTIAASSVVSASSNVVPLAGGAAGTAILAATAGKWADLQYDGSAWQIMAAN